MTLKLLIFLGNQKGLYVHNDLPYFSHSGATRKNRVHTLYVIRGLLNVKQAGFQLYAGQDQAQQYKTKL